MQEASCVQLSEPGTHKNDVTLTLVRKRSQLIQLRACCIDAGNSTGKRRLKHGKWTHIPRLVPRGCASKFLCASLPPER
eukprot:1148988-Pelagomonas_calceolata.AAC.10